MYKTSMDKTLVYKKTATQDFDVCSFAFMKGKTDRLREPNLEASEYCSNVF